MKYFIWAFIFILIIACNTQPDKPPTVESTIVSQKTDAKRERRRSGLEEYGRFMNRKYAPDSTFNFETAKVYEIHCPGECGAEELFTKRTGKSTSVSKEEFKRMMAILNDASNYGHSSAACYHPGIAVITYDKNKNPLTYIGICLDCNHYSTNIDIKFERTNPNGKPKYMGGYTKTARKAIRKFLYDIEFPYPPDGGYVWMFDDLEDVRKEMEDLGIDSLEIEERVFRAGYMQ